MAKDKRKPLGKAPDIPEAESDEAATPTAQDIFRADELAETASVGAFWNAEEKTDEG